LLAARPAVQSKLEHYQASAAETRAGRRPGIDSPPRFAGPLMFPDAQSRPKRLRVRIFRTRTAASRRKKVHFSSAQGRTWTAPRQSSKGGPFPRLRVRGAGVVTRKICHAHKNRMFTIIRTAGFERHKVCACIHPLIAFEPILRLMRTNIRRFAGGISDGKGLLLFSLAPEKARRGGRRR